jgi:hypothetical protein
MRFRMLDMARHDLRVGARRRRGEGIGLRHGTATLTPFAEATAGR